MTAAGSALVTGASGFVGSHLVEELLDRGWRVRCLVRRTSTLSWIPTDRVELAYGGVTEPGTLPEALQGVDTVFHVAGVVEAPDESVYHRVNAEGTGHVARALRLANPGYRRFVLVSSVAAAGPSRVGSPRREEEPEQPTSPYGRSKLGGETELKSALDDRWTILRPPAVYGPRDVGFLRLFQMVGKGMAPRFTGRPQKLTVVHVEDLVRGILDAATHADTVNRAYFITHPEITDWDGMGRAVASALGCSYRGIKVPKGALPVAAGVMGFLTGLIRKPNPMPPDRVRDLLEPAWTYSADAARRDFGFAAVRDLASGIPHTAAWYRETGWL